MILTKIKGNGSYFKRIPKLSRPAFIITPTFSNQTEQVYGTWASHTGGPALLPHLLPVPGKSIGQCLFTCKSPPKSWPTWKRGGESGSVAPLFLFVGVRHFLWMGLWLAGSRKSRSLLGVSQSHSPTYVSFFVYINEADGCQQMKVTGTSHGFVRTSSCG